MAAPPSPRLPVPAAEAMVVCPHHLASAAGLRMLHQGGSAVDGAIAAHAALGVVYPHMSGLGGDAFWLIHHGPTGERVGINGSGRCGQEISLADYAGQGAIPQRGPTAAITVPGAVASWQTAHQRFGRLPWADLLQPAIELATEGYPASESQVRWTQKDAPLLRQFGPPEVPFLPQGQVPAVGETLRNPDLARTLTRLAAGAEELYTGETAQRLVAYLHQGGGKLTLADFAAHRSPWMEPIATTYRGYQVCQLPPNSQGFTLLQMLNLIEPYDLGALGHGSADYYHLLVEATKLAFADRDRWLGDPDGVPIPTATLIRKDYAQRRGSRLSLGQAQQFAAGAGGGDTVYLAVVDGEGSAVSTIQSLYFDFGAAVCPPGLGFVVQNRGALFSLDPDHPNALAPGKRPFHTLMPGLVYGPEGALHLVNGTMGGEGQPQTQLALLTRVLDYGFDPQAAVDLPRWLWGRTWGETTTGLTLEGRIPAAVGEELAQRGHQVKRAPAWSEQMGHAHLILRTAQGWLGGCDPRSDGAAMGF